MSDVFRRRFLLWIAAAMLCAVPFSLVGGGGAQDATALQPASGGKKVEPPVKFVPASADPLMGDWQGKGGHVAQVLPTKEGKYRANLLTAFDTEDNVVAVLQGVADGKGAVTFNGDGWQGVIREGHFTAGKGNKRLDLQHVKRTVPTLGARPTAGAIVLFDGRNLDAWAKKKGKD